MKNKLIAVLTAFPAVLFYAQSGHVGINTTSPGNTLEIKSDSDGTSGLRFSNLNSSSNTSQGKPLGVDINGDVVTIPGTNVLSKTFTLTDGYLLGHPSQLVSNASSISSNLLVIDGIQMDVLMYSTAEYVPRIKNLTGNTINISYISNIEHNILVSGNATANDWSLDNGSGLSLSSAPVGWVLPTNARILISINNTSWYELKWFCYTKGIPGVKYVFMSAQRIF